MVASGSMPTRACVCVFAQPALDHEPVGDTQSKIVPARIVIPRAVPLWFHADLFRTGTIKFFVHEFFAFCEEVFTQLNAAPYVQVFFYGEGIGPHPQPYAAIRSIGPLVDAGRDPYFVRSCGHVRGFETASG